MSDSLITDDTSTEAAQGDNTQTDQNVAALPAESKPTENVVKPVVPEKYEFQMPEGVELDTVAASELSVVAKELGLTQEQAGKVAQVGAQMALRRQQEQRELVEQWVSEVKADKEIGGEKLNENLAIARKTIDTFGSTELRDFLNASGFGNNIHLIRFAHKIGKAISEDGFVKAGKQPVASRAAEEILYPSMNKA